MKVTIKIYDECAVAEDLKAILANRLSGLDTQPAEVGAVLQEYAVNNWLHLKIHEVGVFSLYPMALRSERVEIEI